MSRVKEFKVVLCDRSEVKEFIEKWHYSKSINGIKSSYCFGLFDDKMIGAMIYGRIAMANVWVKYVKKESDIIELRRLCCVDDAPKNTESFFIGSTLRWLRDNTNLKQVLSYADTMYGHRGVIYHATNFKHLGKTAKGRVIIHNGKLYHDKCIRTKYNGKVKPFGQRVKDALESGEAHYKQTTGKHIFLYNLRGRVSQSG